MTKHHYSTRRTTSNHYSQHDQALIRPDPNTTRMSLLDSVTITMPRSLNAETLIVARGYEAWLLDDSRR